MLTFSIQQLKVSIMIISLANDTNFIIRVCIEFVGCFAVRSRVRM